MFDPASRHRLFGVSPGIDFPKALLNGLEARLQIATPEAFARTTIIVNTRRMERRLRALLADGPPRLLPRILTLTEVDQLLTETQIPPAAPTLQRRLDLAALIGRYLETDKRLAPRHAIYDMADSLAALMDELHGEGVAPEVISELDVSDLSGHWARTQAFIGIAQTYLQRAGALPDPEARQRAVVDDLGQEWTHQPPKHPVIVAGSTGSRGTTLRLMEHVAQLPQGALVVPGFDFDLPRAVWASLDAVPGRRLSAEDHPQFRFRDIMKTLGLDPDEVEPWCDMAPVHPARNRLVSLALRPAPVTDAWLREGPELEDLAAATEDVTLLEASSPRIEALTIAMRLRMAAETGQKAALITPDRMLTRQVAAALDRWDIVPDDSAGMPLPLSPVGRFLRHIAGVLTDRLDAENLLSLLKHPLTAQAGDRGHHQLFTQRLELQIRKTGLPYPDAAFIAHLSAKASTREDEPATELWSNWIGHQLDQAHVPDVQRSLGEWAERHQNLAEALYGGPDGPDEDIWNSDDGVEARKVLQQISDVSVTHGIEVDAQEYVALFAHLLDKGEVRNPTTPHSDIMIWGTMEARVQGADLVILGGLNEGTWPERADPDPWLNRQMRFDAGLLLPERRIGLSAHDFEQAVAAPEVWLTRSIRSEDAETVPSRWIYRLQNLLQGLPDGKGPEAWEDMRQRGKVWQDQAAALEEVVPKTKAERPSPVPPLAARPRVYSVTDLSRLIRDPYAIYAKRCLGLQPLRPLVPTADALLRGTFSHKVLEQFVTNAAADRTRLTSAYLMELAETVLAEEVPWPAARALWLARLHRVSEWLVNGEMRRLDAAHPAALEEPGKLELESLGVTVRGRADRIDLTPDGAAQIYDYKTGSPPSRLQQMHFDIQLLAEAVMLNDGAFEKLGPRVVAGATYIGLGASPSEVSAPLDDLPPDAMRARLIKLLGAYLEPDQGYTSRRSVERVDDSGDYDALARFGEWDLTTPAKRQSVGE